MPELPDLVYIQKNLGNVLPGQQIEGIQIKEPIVLRILLQENLQTALINLTFGEVIRHGPFLCFKLSDATEIIIHPMLAGKFKYATVGSKGGRGLCFSIFLKNEMVLHYLDEKRMGKAYFVKSGNYAQIPRFQEQGTDILSKEFTLKHFQTLIHKQRKQVRVFLMDQTRLSAIGNAYADEILFEAALHPKTFCYQLAQNEIDCLYKSIKKIMSWGIAEVEKANQPIEIKVRGHVKVRNRKDQPCPKCGTTIRRAGVLGYDSYFCPTCQPAKRNQFIEWD